MRIQFEQASDLFLAFPTLADDVAAQQNAAPVLDYLAMLRDGEQLQDAVTFFAYLAPKREAVWWACRCIRLLGGGEMQGAAVRLAEQWVRTPEEEHRRAALAHAEMASRDASGTWAAYGAGWSGGNIAADGSPSVLAAAQLTAKAVRAAVLIAIAEGGPSVRAAAFATCLDEALRLAEQDTDAELAGA